ncbi:FMN-binding negative transcriptional regulator [Hydrocarboniphaga sp.]|uniref:FMN-binding negative transcriptional regulator n=1 Tax=Hydrocarboniphaga sp. TaxID=2033016 RepID=UPI003D0F00CB
MSLYAPAHFAQSDRAAAEALIAAHPFATLITALDGAEPQISHLPLLLEGDALIGHLAKANPHWQRFEQGTTIASTIAIFHGPHAYVSPRWYAEPERNVPTWNYATVHVSGQPQLLDRDAARSSLLKLTQAFDPQWQADEATLQRLLPGIVAFRMPVARVETKFKMSQNKTADDQRGVIAGLLAADDRDAASVAQWMRQKSPHG